MPRTAGPTGPSYQVPSYEPMGPFLGHAEAAATTAAAAGGGDEEEDGCVVGRLTLENEAMEMELKEAMDVQLDALVQLEVAAYREQDPGGAHTVLRAECSARVYRPRRRSVLRVRDAVGHPNSASLFHRVPRRRAPSSSLLPPSLPASLPPFLLSPHFPCTLLVQTRRRLLSGPSSRTTARPGFTKYIRVRIHVAPALRP